jgi:hypothetical protein
MTISTDPWKLIRIVLALAVVTLMNVRPMHMGMQPFYDDDPKGCSMIDEE